MITCPNCQHNEITGAIFCSNCGARLVHAEAYLTHVFRGEATQPFQVPTEKQALSVPTGRLLGAAVSLHILNAGQILPLSGKEEFIIGRSAEGQAPLPDIDLANYRAYEKGVSRLHASIKASGSSISITDLGSVNGTRLNGRKIVPNEEVALNHGDILSLGKMQIQILIRR